MDVKFLMSNHEKGKYQLKEINELNKSSVFIGQTIEGQDDLVAVTYVENVCSYDDIYCYHICIVGRLEKGLYLKDPIKLVQIEDTSFYDKITTSEFEEVQHKIETAINLC